MIGFRRDRQFRLQGTAMEIAVSNFLTIHDLLSILDKSTARAVAKRIRQQATTIDAILGTDPENNITRAGIESVRKLFLEACR